MGCAVTHSELESVSRVIYATIPFTMLENLRSTATSVMCSSLAMYIIPGEHSAQALLQVAGRDSITVELR